jgi:cell wall assembly regulator SMI1
MKVDDIQWEGSGPPVSEEHVVEVEKALGVRFPDDYRRLIPQCHGASPTPVDYIESRGTGPHQMLSFDPADEYYIVDTVAGLAIDNQLPDKVIPFAEDAGGDMMCFDFREDPANPKVIYWAHDSGEPDPFYFLASSFTEFIEMLVEDPYAEMFAPSDEQ